MSTPTTRRYFLNRFLAALAAAPLLVRAALAPKQPKYVLGIDPSLPGSDLTSRHAYWVQGPAIKVPSNRVAMGQWAPEDGIYREWHQYEGPWDGTFKLKRGCTNPAYILADLTERAGGGPDWVLRDKSGALKWRMLYDFGRWCDEVVPDTQFIPTAPLPHKEGWHRVESVTRFTVNTTCTTQEEIDQLRETLRMHCLSWQSTDPRYRTSWPGIPYPEDRA